MSSRPGWHLPAPKRFEAGCYAHTLARACLVSGAPIQGSQPAGASRPRLVGLTHPAAPGEEPGPLPAPVEDRLLPAADPIPIPYPRPDDDILRAVVHQLRLPVGQPRTAPPGARDVPRRAFTGAPGSRRTVA